MLLLLLLAVTAPDPAKPASAQTATSNKPAAAASAAKRIDPAKEADIRKLMTITGMSELGPGVAKQVMESFRAAYPKVPEALWGELQKRMDPASVTTLCVPVYDRHFSAEELAQLIAFYETPLGKKVLKELPGLTAESMEIAEAWGYKTGERMAGELEAKGYKLPQATR